MDFTNVTKAAEYLRWADHGRTIRLFGKPYIWVIDTGRLSLVRPSDLPQLKDLVQGEQ